MRKERDEGMVKWDNTQIAIIIIRMGNGMVSSICGDHNALVITLFWSKIAAPCVCVQSV